MVCVYSGDDENSPLALIKKLASIKNPMAIEPHKKLMDKTSAAEPNFRAKIFAV